MSNNKSRTEVWTYVGLREQKNGGFAYAWRDPEGHIYVFKKRFRNVSIGAQIEVTLTEGDKIVITGPDAPKPLLSRYKNDDEVANWVTADECANNSKRLKAIERKAARVAPLDDILSTIRRLSATLSTPQRRALVAIVLEAIYSDRR